MILSVYCPNGRVGKTTTALACAKEAQSVHGINTCVLEFDFSPGDIPSILGLDSAKNILDAADEHFDVAIQKPQSEDFDVIVGGYPDYPEQLKSEDVLRTIDYLENQYDLVIIDIQPNFIEQVIDIFEISDKIMLVLNNDQQGIARVLKTIDWGIKSGYMDEEKFEVLINKFNKKDKINYITEAQLNYPLVTTIPLLSNFKGYTDERFTKYMGDIITVLFPELDVKIPKKKGFFSTLFGSKKKKEPAQETNLFQLSPPLKEENTSLSKKEVKENNSTFDNISDLLQDKSAENIREGEDTMLDLSEDIFTNEPKYNVLSSDDLIEEDSKQEIQLNNLGSSMQKEAIDDSSKIIIDTNTINDANDLPEDTFKLAEDTVVDNKNEEDIFELEDVNISQKELTQNTLEDDSDIDINFNTNAQPVVNDDEFVSKDIPKKEIDISNPLDIQTMINNFVAESNKQIKELTISNTELETKLIEMKVEKEKLEMKINELTTRYKEHNDTFSNLEQTIDLQKHKLDKKENYILELEKKITEQESYFKNKLSQVKKKIQELDSLI